MSTDAHSDFGSTLPQAASTPANSEEDELPLTLQRPTSESPESPTGHTHTIMVRIYVYPQGGRWYAATTELPLMGDGASEEEAVMSLLDSARAYLGTALANGWLDALTRRPALTRRLEIRARWRIASLLHPHRHSHRINKQLRFAA
jgi:hypothetical protein